jgi:hypothetical protein
VNRAVLNACIEGYCATDLTHDGSVLVLQTDQTAQQVFDAFRTCLKPNALLFVSALKGSPFCQRVKPGAERLLLRDGQA